MCYEKEYTFFKNIAERFHLPVYELKESSFSVFWNCKAGIYLMGKEEGNEQVQYILEHCPEQKIMCVQDKAESINILFLRLPDQKERTMLVLGPFSKKDFLKAYGIMAELARIFWNDDYEFERYSFSLKQIHPIIKRVVDDIEEDVTKKHTLRSISKKMCVSPGHLSKLFTQEMGMSLTEYVNRKKVEYGAYLLNTTEDKVCSIAIQCGMPDNNYFSRLFKRYVGVSPAEYRKKGVPEKAIVSL